MTSLIQKIGLVLGATTAIAGSAHGAKNETIADYLDLIPKDKPFTVTCEQERQLDSAKKCNYGIKTYMKTSDDKIVYQTDRMYKFVSADMTLGNVKNVANLYSATQKPLQPKQKPGAQKASGIKSEEKTDNDKKDSPSDEDENETPSNGYWIFGAGGDSNNRAFGLVERDWKYGQDERHRFGLGLKLYSGSEVIHGDESTKTTLVDEALVGPNVYRIRTDKTTTREDRKDGQLEIFAHFGYVPEFFENNVELFGNFGATSHDKISHETINSKVKFEDSKGNPAGKTETSKIRLKPETENYIVPTAELGVTWQIPKTNIRLGLSEEISPKIGEKTNATVEFKF